MYTQISYSADPNIIGVSNGVSQLIVNERALNKSEDGKLIEALFINISDFNIETYNEKVFNLENVLIKAKTYKKTKITDIMVFEPFFFGCQFIISEKLKEMLEKYTFQQKEYRTFPVSIDKLDENFYLFWVPFISHQELIFSKSIIINKITNNKIEVQNYSDYKELLNSTVSFGFTSVCIPEKYRNNSIINVQGIGNYYFSNELIGKLQEKNVSSLLLKQKQVELSFG